MNNEPTCHDTLEALAGLPTIGHPTVSPDGRAVACYYDVTGRNEIHVVDAETGERTQWSDGNVPRDATWPLSWSVDGDRIYYHQDDSGDELNDVYALTADGTTEPVVELDGQVALLDVGDDGRTLVVGSNRDGQMNLFRHDRDTDETTKLTEYEYGAGSATLSPSCDRIAYTANETDDLTNGDVYVANRDGSNPQRLDIGEQGAETTPVEWGPDGSRLLVTDNSADLGRMGVYDLESAEISWYGDGEFEETAITFLGDGERLLASRVRDVRTVPVVYDTATGDDQELDLPDGVAAVGSMMGQRNVELDGDRLLVVRSKPTKRPELLAYDLDTDQYEVLVEAEYGPFERSDFADAEHLTVTSDGVPATPARAVEHDAYDELEIDAIFYDSGERPSPLLINPHGGPPVRDTLGFDLYTQVLVSQGFSVLQVNYRGSTGRGREFVERLIDDWGGAEQGDVATAAEYVLETYDWIDEDRVVVFGGSYGGYAAYWQLVQYPDLYDAGIAWVGVTDLVDMYENTFDHFRTGLMERYLGTPEENPDLYEARSPVTHTENVDVPLLMVHGVNDNRVPISQARIFRDALRDAGYDEGEDGEFEYVELGDEGHGSTDQAQKLRTFRLLADFLDRRV